MSSLFGCENPHSLVGSRESGLRGLALGCVWLGCVAVVALGQVVAALALRTLEVDPWLRIRFITLLLWLPWVVLAPSVALISSRIPDPTGGLAARDRRSRRLVDRAALLHGVTASVVYHYSPARDARDGGFRAVALQQATCCPISSCMRLAGPAPPGGWLDLP